MRNYKTTNPIADMEQNISDALLDQKEIERFTTPVDIHIHSKRTRLADPDGISAKAIIDGLVHTGLLRDDTSKEINIISYSQEKATEEETIITITEV